MTLNTRVTDDQLGAYFRKTVAIADRLGKSLDPDKVMAAMQRIHDGELDPVVLNALWANPDDHWNLDDGIVFRLRK